MVAKYEQLRAQNKIKPEESTSLASEKFELDGSKVSLKNLTVHALQKGTGFFEGVITRVELGNSASESLRAMLDYAVPRLPKTRNGHTSFQG